MKKKQRSDKNPNNADAQAGEKPALPGSDAESFGPWLRRQREGREIDLREIAEASKIGLRYLQAFEENRFDVLPADVFAKGFLRQYSKYVGLDAEEVITYFIAARQASQSDEEDEITRAIKIRTKNTNRQRTAANRRFALVVLLVAAVLLLVVWQLSEWQQRDREPAPELSSQSEPAVAPLPTAPATPTTDLAATTPAGTDPAAAGTPGAAEGQLPAQGVGTDPTGTASTAQAGTPDLGTNPNPANPASPNPGAAPTASNIPDPAQILATTAQSGALVKVRLEFQANCWVEAAVDGKRQLSAMRTQGEFAEFSGDEVVELKLGDYRSSQVEVNGRPLTLVPDSNKSTVVRLKVDLPLVAQLTGIPLDQLEKQRAERKKAAAAASNAPSRGQR